MPASKGFFSRLRAAAKVYDPQMGRTNAMDSGVEIISTSQGGSKITIAQQTDYCSDDELSLSSVMDVSSVTSVNSAEVNKENHSHHSPQVRVRAAALEKEKGEKAKKDKDKEKERENVKFARVVKKDGIQYQSLRDSLIGGSDGGALSAQTGNNNNNSNSNSGNKRGARTANSHNGNNNGNNNGDKTLKKKEKEKEKSSSSSKQQQQQSVGSPAQDWDDERRALVVKESELVWAEAEAWVEAEAKLEEEAWLKLKLSQRKSTPASSSSGSNSRRDNSRSCLGSEEDEGGPEEAAPRSSESPLSKRRNPYPNSPAGFERTESPQRLQLDIDISDSPNCSPLRTGSSAKDEYNSSTAGLSPPRSSFGKGYRSSPFLSTPLSGGRSLHDKLSSPDRRKALSPSEAMRRHEARQIAAESNRDMEIEKKIEKASIASTRVKIRGEKEAQRKAQAEKALKDRLENAEKRHDAQLKKIRGTAANENTKVSEVMFINNLNGEVVAEELQRRLKEVEERTLAASQRREERLVSIQSQHQRRNSRKAQQMSALRLQLEEQKMERWEKLQVSLSLSLS